MTGINISTQIRRFCHLTTGKTLDDGQGAEEAQERTPHPGFTSSWMKVLCVMLAA
jgi:hypothetical protein